MALDWAALTILHEMNIDLLMFGALLILVGYVIKRGADVGEKKLFEK